MVIIQIGNRRRSEGLLSSDCAGIFVGRVRVEDNIDAVGVLSLKRNENKTMLETLILA